tara:strand:+ start:891257 stop:891550 length:294 start_codon:yes stop_codon:yes gene_type:complete
MGYPPFIGADGVGEPETHWREMPMTLKQELQKYIDAYPVPDDELDGPCCWYDATTRLCKHHAHRPNVCRDFRVGSQVCRQWRDHYREDIAENQFPEN